MLARAVVVTEVLLSAAVMIVGLVSAVVVIVVLISTLGVIVALLSAVVVIVVFVSARVVIVVLVSAVVVTVVLVSAVVMVIVVVRACVHVARSACGPRPPVRPQAVVGRPSVHRAALPKRLGGEGMVANFTTDPKQRRPLSISAAPRHWGPLFRLVRRSPPG